MIDLELSRRDWIRGILSAAAVAALPASLAGCSASPEGGEPAEPDTAEQAAAEPTYAAPTPENGRTLERWLATLRGEGLAAASVPLGLAAARVGEMAGGTPYVAYTLEEYLKAGDSPMRAEPLTLHLDKFDCVTLVESCLAAARVARTGAAGDADAAWQRFAREMERMRYRGGEREGYASRLHYFSEWIDDGERRGLVRSLGQELGGVADTRPLRFMTSNAESYPALRDPETRQRIADMERSLDGRTRWVIPTERIPEVEARLETGDVLAFATGIEGLDVTHAAFAYRDDAGVMRVLHAPLSGGEVEVTDSTLPEYVAAIRRSTGILVARPLPAV